jgi:hypothetical protein
VLVGLLGSLRGTGGVGLKLIPVGQVADSVNRSLAGASAVTTYQTHCWPYNTFALVSSATEGVHVIDITDPTAPLPMGSASDGTNGFNALAGAMGAFTFHRGCREYAAVAAFDDDAVQLIELTDPNQLVAVGELRDTDLLKLNGPRDLAGFVLDDKVYIIVASPYDDGVQMIDVTDPSNVTALDGASNGEAGFSELDVAYSVETYQMGNSVYAIVASRLHYGIQVIDVTDPSHIVALGNASSGNHFSELEGGVDLAVWERSGSHYAIVVGQQDDSVHVLNVTDPEHPSALGSATDDESTMLYGARGVATLVKSTLPGMTFAVVASRY